MKKQSAFTLRSGNKPSVAKLMGVSPMKVDLTKKPVGPRASTLGPAETGHGGPKFPSTIYTEDGTATKTSQLDEGQLDEKPSTDGKGKYVNYTKDDGTKIKYYYNKPTK